MVTYVIGMGQGVGKTDKLVVLFVSYDIGSTVLDLCHMSELLWNL